MTSSPDPATALFEHLLEINARLIGLLDGSPGETPDTEALSGLLDVRAALLRTLQGMTTAAPTDLRPLLLEQHHRLDALLRARSREAGERLEQIERFEQAQAHYAPATPRRVLRSSLNI